METPPRDKLQGRLLLLAALFLIVYALVMTLSPVVRLHSWLVPYRWSHWIGMAVWLAGAVLLNRLTQQRLPERDPYLLPIAALLSGWGLLSIWRLDPDFGLRQTIWLCVCLVCTALIVLQPRQIILLRRYKYLWLTGGLLLTGLTFVFGTYPGGNGPHLWLGCCGVYLQPSEPLKLLLIIYLAAYLADRSWLNQGLLPLLLPTLFLTGAALAILVAQRDLGTASLFIMLYTVAVYIAAGKKRLLVFSGLLIILAAGLGYSWFDVIQIRVAAWLNPWDDPSGHAYQIIQSLLAVAAGGTFGIGPGIGNPGVVPVAQSDFIFAAIAEETGLAGTFGLLILFAILAVRGMATALRAVNTFQRLLAAGITVNLVAQSLLIMAGNLRLLPLTGVTLPLVSYGGSSLLTSYIAIALLLVISNHPEEDSAPVINPQPFMVTGSALLIGLLVVGSANFYWGFFRATELQDRPDNPRWSVTDHYVARGRILDRNNQPIAVNTGQPGTYQRQLQHTPLGPVIGYSNPLYGKAGLESALDSFLRGLEGNPSSTIAYYHLVHGQPPPGLDVRLSLDMRIQARADELLSERSGALILLNSQTGEILAMASHPGIDPNQLDANWEKWRVDPGGVFVNRTTQGQYSPGTVLGPFVLATVLNQENLPPQPESLTIQFDGSTWDCALPLPQQPTWGDLISHGCPAGTAALAQRLHTNQVLEMIHQVALDRIPLINLPVAPVTFNPTQDTVERLALGQGSLSVSPLQMALAASALNPQGEIPNPRIATAVNTPTQGWVVLPASPITRLPEMRSRAAAAKLLQMDGLPAWSVTATSITNRGKIAWFVAGTTSDWRGAPLALALVLEHNDPNGAAKIGSEILKMILMP
jgi:cell division protein FtsW (lipid II flippase)